MDDMIEKKYLSISLFLYAGRFHGKTADQLSIEWPPSPWRLFQALISGSALKNKLADWEELFLWLEQQPDPIICTPVSVSSQPCLQWVLNNDKERKRYIKKVHCKIFDPSEPIRFIYTQDINKNTSNDIQNVVNSLHIFGTGLDSAFARVENLSEEELTLIKGEKWFPHVNPIPGGIMRKSPMKGSFFELIDLHTQRSLQNEKLLRKRREPYSYRNVYYRSTLYRPYAAFVLRSSDDVNQFASFDQAKTNHVAAMLRSLLCNGDEGKIRANFNEFFPQIETEVFLAGHHSHEATQRFSYIPIPTIRSGIHDGRIRRVLVVEPNQSAGNFCEWASSILDRKKLVYTQSEQECAILDSLSQEDAENDSVLAYYVGESKFWKSVTPVVLPGFDKKHSKKDHFSIAEELVLKSIRHAGITANIKNLRLSKSPFVFNALHVKDYFYPDYLRHRPAWHVDIEFESFLKGPLSIGAGRHCGFGVLATI